MTAGGDDAVERMAIDLTGSETTELSADSAVGKRSAASNNLSAIPTVDSDALSPVVLCREQDARFANFTPTRRKPKPHRFHRSANSSDPDSTAAATAAGRMHESGGGGSSCAIDLNSDNEESTGDEPVIVDSPLGLGRSATAAPATRTGRAKQAMLASISSEGDSEGTGSVAALAARGSNGGTGTALIASSGDGPPVVSDVDTEIAPDFGPELAPDLAPDLDLTCVPISSSSVDNFEAPAASTESPGEVSSSLSTWTPPLVLSPELTVSPAMNGTGNAPRYSHASAAAATATATASFSALASAGSACTATPFVALPVAGEAGSMATRGGSDTAGSPVRVPRCDAAPGSGMSAQDERIERKLSVAASEEPARGVHAPVSAVSGSVLDIPADLTDTGAKIGLDSGTTTSERKDGEGMATSDKSASPVGSTANPDDALPNAESQDVRSTGAKGGSAAAKGGETRIPIGTQPHDVQPTRNGAASASDIRGCSPTVETHDEVDAGHDCARDATALPTPANGQRNDGGVYNSENPVRAATCIYAGTAEEIITASAAVAAAVAAATAAQQAEGLAPPTTKIAAPSNVSGSSPTTAAQQAAGLAPPTAKIAAPSNASGSSPTTAAQQAEGLAPPTAKIATPSNASGSSPTPATAAQKAAAKSVTEVSLRKPERATGKAGKPRKGPLDKPCSLYLQVIGPAPTQEKVPPAKRVTLAEQDAKPADLLIMLTKPGVYTLYVTASPNWTGSGVCQDPSEQPIEIKSFSIPDSMFPKEEESRCSLCGEVFSRNVIKRINKDPLGSGPLKLRLVPRSGLCFLADLTVHVSIPHSGKCLPCRACTNPSPSTSSTPTRKSGHVVGPPPSGNYVALTNEEVASARALALKVTSEGGDPAIQNRLTVPAVRPPECVAPADEDSAGPATQSLPAQGSDFAVGAVPESQPPTKGTVLTATPEPTKTYSIHDALGLQKRAHADESSASTSTTGSAELDGGIAVSPPPMSGNTRGISPRKSQLVPPPSPSQVSSEKDSRASRSSAETEALVEGAEKDAGAQRIPSVEEPTREAQRQVESRARQDPSTADAGDIHAATPGLPEPTSSVAPIATPAPPAEGVTSFHAAQASQGRDAVQAVGARRSGAVGSSLGGFRHALDLLAHAVRVGAENHKGKSREVLSPVFDRLQNAVSVAKASGSIQPESLEKFQNDFDAVRQELMGASLYGGDVERSRPLADDTQARAAESNSSDSGAWGCAIVADARGGRAIESLPQPRQPEEPHRPVAGTNVSQQYPSVSQPAEADAPFSGPTVPAVQDREFALDVGEGIDVTTVLDRKLYETAEGVYRQAAAASQGISLPPSGAAPHRQNESQSSTPQQQQQKQQRHSAQSPFPQHQQFAGQSTPPPHQNALSEDLIRAPPPPALGVAVLRNESNEAAAMAMTTAPSNSPSCLAERVNSRICPNCGGAGWANDLAGSCSAKRSPERSPDPLADRGSCRICLWNEGGTSPMQGVSSLRIKAAGQEQDQRVGSVMEGGGGGGDGQLATPACSLAETSVVWGTPVPLVDPSAPSLSKKRSSVVADLYAPAAPGCLSIDNAAEGHGVEEASSPSPISVVNGKRSKSAPNGLAEEAAAAAGLDGKDGAVGKNVLQSGSESASLRHSVPEDTVAATHHAVVQRQEMGAAAATEAAAAAARQNTLAEQQAAALPAAGTAAALATRQKATAEEQATAVEQAIAVVAAAAAPAAARSSQDLARIGTSTCSAGRELQRETSPKTGAGLSAPSIAVCGAIHAEPIPPSVTLPHAGSLKNVVVVSARKTSQLGELSGMQVAWTHPFASSARQHMYTPRVVGAVAEGTAVAHAAASAHARARAPSPAGWVSTHGAGCLVGGPTGTEARTDGGFSGVLQRACPPCGVPAAVSSYPPAPFPPPGHGSAVPGSRTGTDVYGAQIRAVLAPSVCGDASDEVVGSFSVINAAQKARLVYAGSNGRGRSMSPKKQLAVDAAAARGGIAHSLPTNGRKLDPGFFSSSTDITRPPGVATTRRSAGPASALSSTASTQPAAVSARASSQSPEPPDRLLGKRKAPSPGAAMDGSPPIRGAVGGGPPAQAEQCARVGEASSPLLSPSGDAAAPLQGQPGSSDDMRPSSGKCGDGGSAAKGMLGGGTLAGTGSGPCASGARGGGVLAKGHVAVRRVGGEEELTLARATAAKKLRRETLLRRSIASAELLHLQFRSLEGPAALNRGGDELSKLYLAEGDPIMPDNTRWSVVPRGQPLPYDCLFPDHETRCDARPENSGGTRAGGRQHRTKGLSGSGSSREEELGPEHQELTGEWRD